MWYGHVMSPHQITHKILLVTLISSGGKNGFLLKYTESSLTFYFYLDVSTDLKL